MGEEESTQSARRSAPLWAGLSNRALALDLIERLIVCAWYGTFAVRFLHTFIATLDPTMLLLVLSEGTVVAFTLFRRPATTISLKPVDWLLAMGGTVLPLCAQPESGAALVPMIVCILIMIMGFGFQIWAKFTLRKRFGIVAANRGVQARGPYGLVRHPMYAGYTLTEVGFFLAHPSLWNAAIYSGALMFQVLRILAEERYLSRDPAYLDLKARVRWRLVPGVF
jgi:protein-S-isoprenylcysteine O-methyltransferase Ste14